MNIYDTAQFEFCKNLEENWLSIRDEYKSIQEKFIPWYEDYLNIDDGWEVLPIYDWPSGKPVEPFYSMVPFTANLVKLCVPMHGAVGFSRLKSNKVIPPHKGLQSNFLRCHLGIDVPEGDIGLEVGGKKMTWKNGRCNVFDDRKLHRAWNFTDKDRVILLVDFIYSSDT